jgi:hypothetical protein
MAAQSTWQQISQAERLQNQTFGRHTQAANKKMSPLLVVLPCYMQWKGAALVMAAGRCARTIPSVTHASGSAAACQGSSQ